uniref:Transposase (Putative), gypsy type n=1 Tax=Tanacetum cinerariifolium TaxID=118510 RepID=A0A6L2MXR8_TANCI|nr:hypothetical protein [Tanacetum cinerariifolium]
MSAITDIRYVLAQKALDAFCAKFHIPRESRRQGKRKFVVVDAGGVSQPPKKQRGDHGTPSGASIGAFVSVTLKREDGDHTDSVAEPNLLTIGALQRFVVSSDSSHHSGTKVTEAEVDSLIRSFIPIITVVTTITSTVDPTLVTKEKFLEPYPFGAGSSFAGETDPIAGVPQWSVMNGSRLDDSHLFIEFNVGAAPQMSLSVEVRMRAEYNVKEKRRLKSVVESQGELLKSREEEIESLKARLLLREVEAAKAIHLRAEASNFETVTELETSVESKERELTDLNALVTSVKSQNDNLAKRIHELEMSSGGLQEKVTVYKNFMEQLERFQDDRMKVVNDKFDKLYTEFVEMALHLEEKFYPHLLTTISSRRWLLTQGMKLAIIKCLNSPKYLSTLGAAISKAIKKVRGSCFPSRSLNLYAPFPSASVTSYGPSHLGPSFLVSSAWLDRCSGTQALSFYTKSTSDVLNVGMPISAGMTASIPYVNENGVSSLLDIIMTIGLGMFDRSKVLADA